MAQLKLRDTGIIKSNYSIILFVRRGHCGPVARPLRSEEIRFSDGGREGRSLSDPRHSTTRAACVLAQETESVMAH